MTMMIHIQTSMLLLYRLLQIPSTSCLPTLLLKLQLLLLLEDTVANFLFLVNAPNKIAPMTTLRQHKSVVLCHSLI